MAAEAMTVDRDVLLAALCEWAAQIDNEIRNFSELLDRAARDTPDADDPRVRELVEELLRTAHDVR